MPRPKGSKNGQRPFWSKVDKSGECWIWTGAVQRGGYGHFWDGERFQSAHRFAWEQSNGPIPEGMFLCHRCDTPACVRPDHLFLGTHHDNMADMRSKGRSRNGSAKLNAQQIVAIRQRYSTGAVRLQDIAFEYGVDRSTVGYVVRGATWAHVSATPEGTNG